MKVIINYPGPCDCGAEKWDKAGKPDWEVITAQLHGNEGSRFIWSWWRCSACQTVVMESQPVWDES